MGCKTDEDVRIPERRKRDEDGDPSKRSEGGRAPVVWGKDCFIYVPLPSLASLTTLLLFKKSELFSVHRRNPQTLGTSQFQWKIIDCLFFLLGI